MSEATSSKSSLSESTTDSGLVAFFRGLRLGDIERKLSWRGEKISLGKTDEDMIKYVSIYTNFCPILKRAESNKEKHTVNIKVPRPSEVPQI